MHQEIPQELQFWSPATGPLNAQERYLLACYIPTYRSVTVETLFIHLHRKLMNEMHGIAPTYWEAVLGNVAFRKTRSELAFDLMTPLMQIVDKLDLAKESYLWFQGISAVSRPAAKRANTIRPTFQVLLGVG